jgi:hypothetical protein
MRCRLSLLVLSHDNEMARTAPPWRAVLRPETPGSRAIRKLTNPTGLQCGRKCDAMPTYRDECAPAGKNKLNAHLFGEERTSHIYAEATSNTRHWASRDTTSSGTRINNTLSHDTCNSRALSSVFPAFAASV